MESIDVKTFDPTKEKSDFISEKYEKGVNENNLKKQKWENELKQYISLLFIILFFLSLVGSTLIFCYITFTNKFNEGIVENLILKNGTKALEWWIDSPIQPLIKVHIFNYTNHNEVLKDPKNVKIEIQDLGPYVFREYSQKINLRFHEDFKITFQDNKTLVFDEKNSNGSLDDIVYVPNVPLLAALKVVNGKSTVEQFGFDAILKTSDPSEFHKKTIREYLFGYSDSFIMMVPGINHEKVGLLAGRQGTSLDNMTIFTGQDSLDNLGRIHAMNMKEKLDIWKTEECNAINATDGSQFPPSLMDTNKDLKIFIKSFCRPLTLKFYRESLVLNGIPAWRYKTPVGEFNSSRTNPAMECYCDHSTEKCLPDGIFDASLCNDGIPLLISYPHFMEVDPNEPFLKNFKGLKPVREDHETYADIHPRMAFPISGASRLQINMKVTTRNTGFLGKTFYKKFPEDSILPLLWFEVTAGDIPAEFQSLVFHTTQSANATYFAIQYGSLIAMIISLILLIVTVNFCFIKRKNMSVQYDVSYNNIYPNISKLENSF